jgi:hypothetical protein
MLLERFIRDDLRREIEVLYFPLPFLRLRLESLVFKTLL